MDLTPECPHCAEWGRSDCYRAGQQDLTPGEAVCGVPRGMGVHTTTCEHEALREAAIVRGEAFYRDNSGASWSVDCTCGGEIGQPCKVCNDGPIEAAYRAGREDAARALEEKIIAGVAIPEPILESLRTGFITVKPFREWVAAIARGEDAQPACSCPDCDVSAFTERPGSRTVKGLDPDCPIHGPTSLGRSAGRDGDNPEEDTDG